MRTLLSIIFQQFDMVIKVPLVAIFVTLIIIIGARFHLGNKLMRYIFGIILLIAFIITMIAGLVMITKPIGVLFLEICILCFVGGIVALCVTYFLDTNHYLEKSIHRKFRFKRKNNENSQDL